MKWAILKICAAYTSGAKRYNLCLEEKLCNMKSTRVKKIYSTKYRENVLFPKRTLMKDKEMSHPAPAVGDVDVPL